MDNMNKYQTKYATALAIFEFIDSLLNSKDYESYDDRTKRDLTDSQFAAKNILSKAERDLIEWFVSILPEKIRVPLSDTKFEPDVRKKLIDYAFKFRKK